MKAKKVYEFKRTRKQGLSDKTELGIKHYKKQTIIDWFNKWFPKLKINSDYEIKDDLSIEVYNNLSLNDESNNLSEFTWIPDNLNIIGNLFLNGATSLNNLPDNLHIDGILKLINTNIKEIPKDIYVLDSISCHNSPLEKLPDNYTVNWNLSIINCPISELPNSLYVTGNLLLYNTNITKLPDNLIVGHSIYTNDSNLIVPEKLKYKVKLD